MPLCFAHRGDTEIGCVFGLVAHNLSKLCDTLAENGVYLLYASAVCSVVVRFLPRTSQLVSEVTMPN